MLLDIFNQDAFSVASLTESINHLPYVPSRIGSLNLFTPKPVTTTSVIIEEQFGRIGLLGTRPRGSGQTQTGRRARRSAISVAIPHIPQDDAILADEVQNVRAFGSETQLELFSNIVNDKLEAMRQNHEVTAEFHRAGAIRGEVLDDDGSTIIDWFDAFGIVEKVVAFQFAVSDGSLKQQATDLIRYIRDALGGTGYGSIHALCGDEFFDALIKSPEVRDSYLRYQDGEFARTVQGGTEQGFTHFGITWENYRGKVGSVDFLEPDECRFFPVGVPGLFQVYYAPADYIETVNTPGRPFYSKQERMKFDKGIELQTQSNPLHVCTRPAVLVKGTIAPAPEPPEGDGGGSGGGET